MTDKEIKEIENVKKASNTNSSQSQELIINASQEFISLTTKVSYTSQYLTIMEVPTAIQTDDSQVIMVKLKSPNKILHDIITHKVGEHSEVDRIAKKGDLSPRLMKTTRKGKKQGNEENTQPIKVQPKRNKSVSC
ncbi:hypothetical protein KY290_031264 [Solanum tuberosum]|uniref:Uncharacterized protein n=1 Tax=Solanum tuberosum TaxID=4113 RepID=A0ABQ7U8V6_SOLTU|nr:hypothetical protein KY290_031264 [Solanum tuberosum]